MFMLMFVLDKIDQLDTLAARWQESGAYGINVIESSRVQLRPAVRFPLIFAQGKNLTCGLVGRYTLFTLVPDEESLQRCMQAAKELAGDRDHPDLGTLAAWPVRVDQDTPSAPLEGELEP